MTYKLYTIRNLAKQDENQWSKRSQADELEVCRHRTLAKLFTTYLPKKDKILEAGCGLGGWVKFLKGNGYSITGIDRNGDLINKIKRHDPELPVDKGDILNIGLDDSALSAYISLGVLEHFEEGPQQPLKEAFRVLAPGGIALISVPSNCLARKLIVHPLRSMVLRLLERRGHKTYFGEYRYDQHEIRNHIEDTGFKIIGSHWDEIIETDRSRHIGIYADFPFMRAPNGAWRLNFLGRVYTAIVRCLSPEFHVSAYLFVGRKPY